MLFLIIYYSVRYIYIHGEIVGPLIVILLGLMSKLLGSLCFFQKAIGKDYHQV